MTEPALYIVRHGDTVLNDGGKFRGFLDVDLNASGRADAEKLRHYFTDKDINSVYSSDLQRAKKTAESIASSKTDMPVDVRSTLRPWNVGDLAGKDKADNKDIINEHVSNPDKPLPGGESLNEFRTRFAGQFEHCYDEAVKEGKPIVIVAHASIAHEVGNIVSGDPAAGDIYPGGILAVYKSRNGRVMRVLKGKKGDGGFQNS